MLERWRRAGTQTGSGNLSSLAAGGGSRRSGLQQMPPRLVRGGRRGPGQAPGADGSDRFPPRPFEPCSSLVGPSQQFLHALNGSVGTDPHRKRTGTQECLLALERKTTQQ